MGRAMESDAKDGVAANNDYTDCEGDREPKKTGIDDILVDYFHDYFHLNPVSASGRVAGSNPFSIIVVTRLARI